MTAQSLLTLHCGALSAGVLPSGGALAFLRSHGPAGATDWLRPAPANPASPLQAASFAMVPFFSRIADGPEAGGRRARLAPAGHGFSHAIHGFGWLSLWSVEECSATAVQLLHDNGGLPAQLWPWRYRAVQRLELDADGLHIALSLTNIDEVPMPAGLGLHPFFPAGGLCLETTADAMHVMDAAGLPCAADARAPALDAFRNGKPLPCGLDNIFEGWSGRALLRWPHGRLALTAAGCDFLCVYSPPDAGFVCVEPVTHTTNAARFGPVPWGRSGARTLLPGETMTIAVHFRPLPEA